MTAPARSYPHPLWFLLLATIALRFAEPVPDSDLFWHMAYARQMLASGTLVPDHTAYSWPPTDGGMIYCAWLSELFFHALWERVGPWSVFAFRYLAIGVMLALAFDVARRAGAARWALTPVVLLVMTLASSSGALLKPELFSLMGLHACLWVWAAAKIARTQGREPVALFYVLPLVLVVWVNAHGGFVLAAPLLAAIAAGESINTWRGRTAAFSRRSLAHLLAACALSVVAIQLTPYGPAYPWQIVHELVLGGRARPDASWNAAHVSIFDRRTLGLHLHEYIVMLMALLVVLARAVRRVRPGEGVDWAMVLVHVAAIGWFVGQLRSTYVWPAAIACSVWVLVARGNQAASAITPATAAEGTRPEAEPGTSMAGQDHGDERGLAWWPAGAAVRGIAFGLALFVAGRAVYEARFDPVEHLWMGFGVGDQNPVAEAEFLAAARLGPRLYNVFDSGGYLLWRLHPHYQVMTDARSFPYLSWFDDQRRFTAGEMFDEFLRRYPGDTAIIDLRKPELVKRFLAAPDWRLVYYGPVAAVFAPTGTPVPDEARQVAPDRFRHIRNPQTARRVRDFARLVGDEGVASDVEGQGR
jgi:type III secretory pathway component EscT